MPFLPAGFDDEVEEMLRFSNRQDDGGEQGLPDAEEERFLNFEGGEAYAYRDQIRLWPLAFHVSVGSEPYRILGTLDKKRI